MNARTIYTSNLEALKAFRKEQESARGDFPGPVSVVYCGEEWREGVKCGADLVVLDYDGVTSDDMDELSDVGVVWEVDDVEQIQEISEKDSGNVFLLSDSLLFDDPNNNVIDIERLEKQLESVPESAVLIASLPSMLPENQELTLGKFLASIDRISSLLMKDCCVNDEEDVKYAQFMIDGISKKSSSTFSMTGLTGSTNGHFGVSSHGREVKWRRQVTK